MKKMHKNAKSYNGDYIQTLGTVEGDVDIELELAIQLERERKSALEYRELYGITDVMESREAALYRNGDDGGKRYMSVDDYKRWINNKTRIPAYDYYAPVKEMPKRRPAAAYQVVGCGKEMAGKGSVCENVFDGSGFDLARLEGTDTNLKGFCRRLIDQWFPDHKVERQNRRSRRRLVSSAAGTAWVLIFTLVFALPIVLGVLKSDAISELNAKEKELYALEKEEADLRAEFESSLDLRHIESVAVNEIGMIKLNDSTIKLLRLNEIDTIESFSERKSNSVVPALLSALGIRAEDE